MTDIIVSSKVPRRCTVPAWIRLRAESLSKIPGGGGASYFDIEDEWNTLVAKGGEPWGLNQHFLDAVSPPVIGSCCLSRRPMSYRARALPAR